MKRDIQTEAVHPDAGVEQHYGSENLYQSILKGLEQQGLRAGSLQPADLAPVDEFHVRGREATVQLARRVGLTAGQRVLDLGCGLGGSARFLADEFGCDVVGVDLTADYVEVAGQLAELVGLSDQVEFRRGSALDLPFEAGCFDVVWTEHVQMNVADKVRFYAEIARVLRPGGALMFHDIFRGAGETPLYPVPWAETEAISHLWATARVRETLEASGFDVSDWEDTTAASAEWFRSMIARRSESGPPPLGIHLLMGATAPQKAKNLLQNLNEGRVAVAQAVCRRTS